MQKRVALLGEELERCAEVELLTAAVKLQEELRDKALRCLKKDESRKVSEETLKVLREVAVGLKVRWRRLGGQRFGWWSLQSDFFA